MVTNPKVFTNQKMSNFISPYIDKNTSMKKKIVFLSPKESQDILDLSIQRSSSFLKIVE